MQIKYYGFIVLFALASLFKIHAQPRKLVVEQKLLSKAIIPQPVIKQVRLPGGPVLEYAGQGSATGIPAKLLHGFTDSWHSFATLLPFLPASVHVYAITQRGHGNSDKPYQPYRPVVLPRM